MIEELPPRVPSVDLAARIARRLSCGDADLERLYTAEFSGWLDVMRSVPAAIALERGLDARGEAEVVAIVEARIARAIATVERMPVRTATDDAAMFERIACRLRAFGA